MTGRGSAIPSHPRSDVRTEKSSARREGHGVPDYRALSSSRFLILEMLNLTVIATVKSSVFCILVRVFVFHVYIGSIVFEERNERNPGNRRFPRRTHVDGLPHGRLPTNATRWANVEIDGPGRLRREIVDKRPLSRMILNVFVR